MPDWAMAMFDWMDNNETFRVVALIVLIAGAAFFSLWPKRRRDRTAP